MRKSVRTISAMLILVVLFGAGLLPAATVELLNGQKYTGKIVFEDETSVKIAVSFEGASMVMPLQKSRIKGITDDSGVYRLINRAKPKPKKDLKPIVPEKEKQAEPGKALSGPVGWRGNGTGHFPDADPPLKWGEKENVLWRTELPNFSASSVIVVGDKLFAGSKQYDLVCLSKETGQILWVRSSSHYDAATAEERGVKPELWKEADALAAKRDALNKKIAACGPTGAFALGQEKAKVEKGLDNILVKIDPERYKVRWRKDGGMANGTPASDGARVFCFNGMGLMACYDMEGGRKWINFQPRKMQEHGYHASPLLIDGKAVVGMLTHMGFDMATGKLVWESEAFQSGNCLWYGNQARAVVGGKTVFVTGDGSMWDPADGTRIGKKPTNSYKNNCTPTVNDGYVCFIKCSYPNKWDKEPIAFYKLPGQAGGSVAVSKPSYGWDRKGELGDITGSPLYHDGLMYVITSNGFLFVYDVAQKSLVYEQKIDFGPAALQHGHRPYGCGVMASPSLAGGKVFIVANTGVTVIIEPGRTYKVVSTNAVGHVFKYSYKERPEGWVSHPFFEGKRIYYRAQKHMYCIGNR